MIRIETEVKLTSPNVKQHYMQQYSKNKKIKAAIGCLLNLERHNLPPLPVHVHLTRYCKRSFDWDNFVTACKPIRDTIADFIIPGKAPGQADSSPDIYWHYDQHEFLSDKKEKLMVEIF